MILFLPRRISSAKKFIVESKLLLIGRRMKNHIVCITYPYNENKDVAVSRKPMYRAVILL